MSLIHKLNLLSVLLPLFVTSACGTLYQVGTIDSKNLIKTQSKNKKATSIFTGETKSLRAYCGKDDIYILSDRWSNLNVPALSVFEVYGMTKKFEKTYYYGSLSTPIRLDTFSRIQSELGLTESLPINQDQSEQFLCASDRFYALSSMIKKEGWVYADYIDKTEEMLAWHSSYSPSKLKTLDEHLNYANKFPKTKLSKDVLTEAFNKFIKISILTKIESKQYPVAGSGLFNSHAGSCKDIKRVVRISIPEKNRPKQSISLDVKYVLKRTYTPVSLEEKDDPIYIEKKYTLDQSNNFTITDGIEFQCVFTALRLHNVALSLIAKIAGIKKKEDSGINTTLTKMSFEFDVTGIK